MGGVVEMISEKYIVYCHTDFYIIIYFFVGIFKIEVFSSITDKVKRTIFLNNIRTQNDFILNSLFGLIENALFLTMKL